MDKSRYFVVTFGYNNQFHNSGHGTMNLTVSGKSVNYPNHNETVKQITEIYAEENNVEIISISLLNIRELSAADYEEYVR